MQHAPKYQFSFSSSIQSQLIVQFERKINKMGNCLSPVQHVKTDEKTEAPLPPQFRLCLKQQWLQLLLTPEFSRIPLVLNKVNKYSHPSFIQIQKDIDRTYPLQSQFNQPQKKNDFKELLQMIALYYPRLGYIQGMNFIAGYLVIVGMTKIEAFNAFRSILFHPQLMLIGIYEDDFPLIRVYCSVFWSLFEQQSAAFAKKVKELNLPDELWVFQWFICLFIYSFPRSYMNDILSFIWKEKQFACVRLALALIKLLQKTVQGKKNFQDEFIECIEMIKDQTYVRKNVPLQSLLREAHRINSKSVNSHLTKLTISNTFIRYFTASPLERTQLYEQLIAEKQREREEYYSLVSKGQSVNCARNSSVTIIDDIEEIRAERYYSRIYNSLSLKVVNQSFVKFQKRYSAHQQQHNNAILTASLYQK